MKNYVRELYDHFSYEEISSRISKLLTPPETKIPVKIIFQTLEGLHRACPDHRGDWYSLAIIPHLADSVC